jgi:hypothetical protein
VSARWTRVALASLAALTLGCATVPPCPAKGGPAWTELSTRHFVIRTDLAAADASELARQLEESRAVLLTLAWPNAADPPGRWDVVAFASQRELSPFVADQVGGSWRSAPPFPPTISLGGVDSFAGTGTVAHEMAHELSRQFLPIQPPWFAEGLATFFETSTYDRSARIAHAGMPPASRVAGLQQFGRLRARELIEAAREPEGGPELGRFENSCWLLFHDLVAKHATGLARFQDLVRRLVEWPAAWKQAFPDLSYEGLDDELDDYFAGGRFGGISRGVDVSVGKIDRRTLRDAEVHDLRASLFATGGARDVQRARAEVAEALAQDPDDVDAVAVSRYFLGGATPDDERLAALARGGHGMRWLAATMMVDAQRPRPPAARATLLSAMIATPDEPEILTRVAALDANAGRWDQALALSERALHLGGGRNLALLVAYAYALAHVGQCPEALFMRDVLTREPAPERFTGVVGDVGKLCGRSPSNAAAPRPSP